jgi:hypothetical protein
LGSETEVLKGSLLEEVGEGIEGLGDVELDHWGCFFVVVIMNGGWRTIIF